MDTDRPLVGLSSVRSVDPAACSINDSIKSKNEVDSPEISQLVPTAAIDETPQRETRCVTIQSASNESLCHLQYHVPDGQEGSQEMPAVIMLTHEVSKQFEGTLRVAQLPPSHPAAGMETSAVETLSALRKDILQLQVDGMENRANQEDSLASIMQSVALLENSVAYLEGMVAEQTQLFLDSHAGKHHATKTVEQHTGNGCSCRSICWNCETHNGPKQSSKRKRLYIGEISHMSKRQCTEGEVCRIQVGQPTENSDADRK